MSLVAISRAPYAKLAAFRKEMGGSFNWGRLLPTSATIGMDQGLYETPLALSMPKAEASDMYRKFAGTGIQLHGGIGMTWEHDLQLYFKRAKACRVAARHRERVARLMGP
ncbi:MAG: hypothetical protein J2P48_16635 [Alphaproteobacteria bacterium]|nr:hypothetical protein [Alphaproteobacteria bacterium]